MRFNMISTPKLNSHLCQKLDAWFERQSPSVDHIQPRLFYHCPAKPHSITSLRPHSFDGNHLPAPAARQLRAKANN
jgi:hypothetical protein